MDYKPKKLRTPAVEPTGQTLLPTPPSQQLAVPSPNLVVLPDKEDRTLSLVLEGSREHLEESSSSVQIPVPKLEAPVTESARACSYF